MGNRNRYLYILGLLAAIGLGFIAGTLLDWPKANESELAGSVGKARKYRNVQMTAKDIELRSDFTKDSAQLRSMIQGMITFSVASDELSKSIDMAVSSFQFKGMGGQASEENQIRILEDYSSYIRNNNRKLLATIDMFTGFYTGDSTDQSQDVERNLREFGSYVKGLVEKNRVLSDAVTTMDNFMLNTVALQSHQSGLKDLKSVRDRLLMKGIQMAAFVGSREQIGVLVQSALCNEEKLGGFEILAAPSLNLGNTIGSVLLASPESMANLIVAAGPLNLVVGSHLLGRPGLDVVLLCYNLPSCQFIAAGQSAVNAISAATNLQFICAAGKDGLNVVCMNYSLQEMVNSGLCVTSTAQDALQIYSASAALGMAGSYGIIIDAAAGAYNVVIDGAVKQ